MPPPVGEAGDRDGTWGGRFAAAMGELGSRQKPGAGVPAYMRWVNRRAARPFAAAAFAAGWRPNHVTALSAAASAAGLLLLVAAPRTIGTGFAVAALLALGFVLDSADGQLARLRGGGGPSGEWVDHVVDAVRTPAVHVSVAAAAWLHGGSGVVVVTALVFAVVASAGFLSQILAEQLSRRAGHADPASQAGPLRSLLLLPVDTGVLCWLFVLWGALAAFTWSYALLLVLHLLHLGVSLRRKYALLRTLGASR